MRTQPTLGTGWGPEVTFQAQSSSGYLWLKPLEQPRKKPKAVLPPAPPLKSRNPSPSSPLQSESGHRLRSPWQPLQSVSAGVRSLLLLKLQEGGPLTHTALSAQNQDPGEFTGGKLSLGAASASKCTDPSQAWGSGVRSGWAEGQE